MKNKSKRPSKGERLGWKSYTGLSTSQIQAELHKEYAEALKQQLDMETPVRIQRSRKSKQVSPNGLPIVYVGRPTKWGNPFRIEKAHDGKYMVKTDGSDTCNEILEKHGQPIYDTKEAAIKDAVRLYQFWLLPYTRGGFMVGYFFSLLEIDNAVRELRGKNLSCWCKVGETCHADYLLKLANL